MCWSIGYSLADMGLAWGPIRPRPRSEERVKALIRTANGICRKIDPLFCRRTDPVLTSELVKLNERIQALCEPGEPLLGYRRLKTREDYPKVLRKAFRERRLFVGSWPQDVYSSFRRYAQVRGDEWDFDFRGPTGHTPPIHFPGGTVRYHPWLSREQQRKTYLHHLPGPAAAFGRDLERTVLARRANAELSVDLAAAASWIRFWTCLGFGFMAWG